MPRPRATEEEFIRLFETHGPTETAKILGIAIKNVYERRKRIEERRGVPIFGPDHRNASVRGAGGWYEKVIEGTIENGCILVGGDAHCWPHRVETAKRAFIHGAKKLRPKTIVLNGDVFDGASISRFPRIGFEWRPTIRQEMDAVQEFVVEVEKAAPNAEKIFTLGNHDIRFETFIANNAPNLEGMPFTTLSDFLPNWRICWRYDLNHHSHHPVVIKHRWASGIHAAYSNALRSGVSFVTGHTHRLMARPWDDVRGTRWGIEHGCLADPRNGDQFADYSEMNPSDQRAGFMVLNFENFDPMEPSPVRVIDESNDPGEGRVEFQGMRYHV